MPLRLATILLWLGCLAWPMASAQAATWTDAMGRQVAVADQPQRIVSLVPSITEILYALGAADRLVGVTNYCTYPPEATGKPQVGDYANPNLEAVALQQPDLVFLSADAASAARLAQMEQLGLRVYIVYPRTVPQSLETIRAVGQVIGATAAGEELARQLEVTIARVRAAVAGRPRPRVLFCVMVQPLTVAGPKNMVGDLIATAGGDNVVPDGPNRYPTWGDEALLLADPDLIVASPHPGTPNPANRFSAWPQLKAVRNQRVVSVNADWVHRPGPRLGLGLLALAEAFHGIDLGGAGPGRAP